MFVLQQLVTALPARRRKQGKESDDKQEPAVQNTQTLTAGIEPIAGNRPRPHQTPLLMLSHLLLRADETPSVCGNTCPSPNHGLKALTLTLHTTTTVVFAAILPEVLLPSQPLPLRPAYEPGPPGTSAQQGEAARRPCPRFCFSTTFKPSLAARRPPATAAWGHCSSRGHACAGVRCSGCCCPYSGRGTVNHSAPAKGSYWHSRRLKSHF